MGAAFDCPSLSREIGGTWSGVGSTCATLGEYGYLETADRLSHSHCSISHSPRGWTDQELGSKWLIRDFEPATAAWNTSNGYCLLILDGHNSHTTYQFCDFAAKHHIIVICLPSHTTHVLHPCDVGVFGPLSRLWKAQVNKASRTHIPINKTNLLFYYSEARKEAFKPSTIQSAFAKTGIHPFNPDVIDQVAFEPAKNTTAKSSQPLPARLPSFLLPLLEGSTSTDALNPMPSSPRAMPKTPTTQNQLRRLIIGIPPSLPHNSSRQALHHQLNELRAIATAACEQVQKDYAQMILMDDENERLRQLAFRKQKKRKKQQTSSHPRHMTGDENLEALARADWETGMKAVFQEAAVVFKAQRKEINNHYKALAHQDKLAQQRQKAAERSRVQTEKLAAVEAMKTAKRQERAAIQAQKAAEALQWKVKKSIAAQACKGKARARGPALCRHQQSLSSKSDGAIEAFLEQVNEEDAETSSGSEPKGTEHANTLSSDEEVVESHQAPPEGVRRSSRLARVL